MEGLLLCRLEGLLLLRRRAAVVHLLGLTFGLFPLVLGLVFWRRVLLSPGVWVVDGLRLFKEVRCLAAEPVGGWVAAWFRLRGAEALLRDSVGEL